MVVCQRWGLVQVGCRGGLGAVDASGGHGFGELVALESACAKSVGSGCHDVLGEEGDGAYKGPRRERGA